MCARERPRRAHGDDDRGVRGNRRETVDFVVEAEKLGLDDCWVAEAWGSDAPSALGYLAARTHRIRLGSCDVPVYLASMSPRTLRLTGRVADGWLGTSFVPEGAGDAYFAYLDAGLAAAGRSRRDLDVCQGAEVAFAADDGEPAAMVADRRKGLAFSHGGMGSAATNFWSWPPR